MLPLTQVKVMTGVGAVLVLLCSIFVGVFPVIFNSIVEKMLVVRADGPAFESFVTPPIPVYMQIWLFNVTNPAEVRYKGAKPVLEEVGPYTYEEVRVKYDFLWSDEGTVSYLQNKSYIFNEELSGERRENDVITTINVLMVLAAYALDTLNKQGGGEDGEEESLYTEEGIIKHEMQEEIEKLILDYQQQQQQSGDETDKLTQHQFAQDILDFRAQNQTQNQTQAWIKKFISGVVWSEIERGMDLFESHKAGEMLFYGYQLPEFNFDFSAFSFLFPELEGTQEYKGTIAEILHAMGSDDLPESLEENLMGLMIGVNNTNDKRYEVKTGEKGMDDYLQIVRWNEKESLSYWFGDGAKYCNMLNGTDGTQYPPGLSRSSVLRLYTSELCRSLYLTYDSDQSVHGVPVYRFVPPREVLEDPLVNHDNLCFCVPNIDHCLGAGMLNMQPCLGLPLVLSTPHFYNGDEMERKKLIGLNPSKAEHETTIDVEPRTGVAMYAAKKMQLNVPLKKYGNLPSFKNVPEVIFPILWVNESARVDAESAKEVRNAVFVPFVVVNAICGSLIGVGALLLVISLVKFLNIKRSNEKL